MHAHGNAHQPGASPALPSTPSMAGNGGHGDIYDGSQTGNFPLFPTTHLAQQRPQLVSSEESFGATSSQLSVARSKLSFGDSREISTSSSSFESGWPNAQLNNSYIPAEQYRVLKARFDEMFREHSSLKKECDRLTVKNGVLKEAYDHLVERVPVSFAPTVLQRSDYPHITYWCRHEYLTALADGKITPVDDAPVNAEDDANNEGEDGEAVFNEVPKKRGKGRASQGENVKLRYIQHENGDIINGWRGMDIRRHARSIFVGFAMAGKVFHSWVEGADAASRASYYHDMSQRFPELAFCELDWKSEQIASEIYTQWRTNWLNKDVGQTKRSNEETSADEQSFKKSKTSRSRSRSRSKSVAPDSSDLVPQINIVADTPAKPKEQAFGQSQFLSVDTAHPAFPPPNRFNPQPQYQFSINKPFTNAPSPIPSLAFLSPTNPSQPTQGFYNLNEHQPGTHTPRGISETPQDDTQKPAKRANKMRVSKHSITPRNLCAKEWVDQYHGTVDEFSAYFTALPAEELERFKTLSASLASKKTPESV